ncbi:2-phosphosulfolactate phosphatase [Thermoanaerobacterium sp. DL9XJH110]|uniref:2-phosphosulfolactate phosphatase n=1 Tax=Thermoanaerobacterium sp. DL9XJH110 TaxID=3386643 RepID=UPI003BB77642
MRIEIYPTAQSVKDLKGKTAIVLDVLRATSVITTALNNGAERVIPVPSVEEAFHLARNLKDNAVLGGEREAVKIPGFDLGNSPLEYKKELVAGKTVILTTSNGTRAVKASESAEHILIGCFLNASGAALKALELAFSLKAPAVAVVCAGTLGEFSLDDATCAGLIVDRMVSYMEKKNETPELSDLAFACRDIYLQHRNDLKAFISHAGHYRRLMSLGFDRDIDYCLRQDALDCVPVYDKKSLAIKPSAG